MHEQVVGGKVNHMRGLWSAPSQQEGAGVDETGCVLGRSVTSGEATEELQVWGPRDGSQPGGPAKIQTQARGCSSDLLSPGTQKWNQSRLVHFQGSTGDSDAHSQLEFVGRTRVWEPGHPRF